MLVMYAKPVGLGEALKILATFILFGGIVGGLTLGLAMALYGLAAQHDAAALASFSQFFTAIPSLAFFGICFGLPAAFATALIYMATPPVRLPWLMALTGAVTSALWGAVLVSIMSSAHAPASHETYLAMSGYFALAGAVAAPAALWALSRMNAT
jgi:hypothetical protein